ncbi:transposase [Azospirillum lipoferum]|nr:transposase [Azospirillum lipoferum]
MLDPLLPAARCLGQPRTVNVREIVNGILFLATSGCRWRQLPKDFPPMTTVQRHFYRWRDDGTWETINHALVAMVRETMGREAGPTADNSFSTDHTANWLFQTNQISALGRAVFRAQCA